MTIRMAALLCSLVFLPVVAGAQEGAKDPALAMAFSDPRLEWGPCPPFMPKGCQVALLRGDPAKPNADVFFRVPAGAEIPRHWHTSSERMVVVSGRVRVAYDGQAPVTLRRGMYAYGPPKVPHAATCATGAPCVLFIAFELPIDAHPGAPE